MKFSEITYKLSPSELQEFISTNFRKEHALPDSTKIDVELVVKQRWVGYGTNEHQEYYFDGAEIKVRQ